MTYKKKLIEVALPLVAISEGGAREQAIKRGKPTQMHKWFAARPMVTSRAVIWASLVDDPASTPERFPTPAAQEAERERLLELLAALADWDRSDDRALITTARTELMRQFDGNLPLIVDPFGGGGTIPLEALRLGLPCISADLNPVPVILQRALLDVPFQFSGRTAVHPDSKRRIVRGTESGLAEDLQLYGTDVLAAVRASHSHLYPAATTDDGRSLAPVAWIWARTVPSPDPSFKGHVPLVKSWILMDDPRRGLAWVRPVVDHIDHRVQYKVVRGGAPLQGTMRTRGSAVCLATGATITSDYIKAMAGQGLMGDCLLAVVGDGNPGRVFCSPADADRRALEQVPAADWKPSGFMSDNARHMGPPAYGMDDWWKLFTPRQLATNVALASQVRNIRDRVVRDAMAAGFPDDPTPLRQGGCGARAYAEAITTYLALVVDRVVDWNNNCCGWDNKNLVNQHLFTRQAVPMMWDFCEIDPLTEGAGSFPASLATIGTAVDALPADVVEPARVLNRDARSLLRDLNHVVVCTDPPYYDSVPYADVSDFFYQWLRFMLAETWPDDLATLATPKEDEIVADSRRHGSKSGAKKHFERGMREFMSALAGSQRDDVPATIFYAYKATETGGRNESEASGWDTFLQAIVDSGMMVTATWPVRTENKSRLRALKSNALATSVVLACRRRPSTALAATRSEFISRLRDELAPAVRVLQRGGIPPVDLSQSAIGPGIAVFSQFAQVVEADGSRMGVRMALGLINEVLTEVLMGEESEFDADTRFALTWFEQYGHSPAAFGDADSLARAKNTTVEGVARAGVVASREGRVRLVERGELPEDWDPGSDARLTVWETTQHLIRALESSESDAADLLRRIGGGMGERARQLAYLLYGVCDRKRWADEAAAYNMLVTAWPEIERLAAFSETTAAADRLF